jgi:hypothetical protein
MKFLTQRSTRSTSRSLRAGKLAVLAAGLAMFGSAFAWDGAVPGTIQRIDVTGGTNQGFRVYLTGMPVMCTNGSTWAYLNSTDSNYNAYVSALLMAKTVGYQVTLYTTTVNGYCQIGYIAVQ